MLDLSSVLLAYPAASFSEAAGVWTWVAVQVAMLNDKIKFQQFAAKRSLATPHVFPITSHDELRRLNSECAVVHDAS